MLSSAQIEAQTADHLVENEHEPLLASELTGLLQESVERLVIFHGLENHGGDLAGIPVVQGLQALDVVVAEAQREAGYLLRHAGVHHGRADEPVVGAEKWMIHALGDVFASGR